MKKIIIGIIASIILILGTVAIVLKWMYPPDRLQALVIAELEERIDRDISLDGVSLAVFPTLGIDVRGLTVSDRPQFSSTQPFVRLDRFLLTLKFWPLLDRELIVDELLFERPVISIIINEEGVANYQDLTASDADAPAPAENTSGETMTPLSIQISSIRIEDGALSYMDRQTNYALKIGEIDESLSLSITSSMNRTMSAGTLQLKDIQIQRPEGPLDGLEVHLDHDVAIDEAGKTIDVKGLTLTIQQMALTLAGQITGYDSGRPVVDLSVASSDITIENIIASLPPDMASKFEAVSGGGRIAVEGTVKGTVGGEKLPDINAALTLRDGRARSVDIPVPMENITADITVKNENLAIKNLSLRMGQSDLALNGTITGLYGGKPGSQPQASLAITSEFLDLDEIAPPTEEPVPFEPYPAMVVTGTGHIKRVRVSGLEMQNARMKLALKDQVVKLTEISADSYGGRITGNITQDLTNLKRPQLAMDTKIEDIDVGTMLDAYLPVKGLLTGRFTSTLSLNSPLDSTTGFPLAEAINALGSLSIDSGRVTNWQPLRKLSSYLKLPDVETINFRRLAGLLRVENGRLATKDLKLYGSNADWVANGSLGLDGSLDYQIKITFAETLTSSVNNKLAGRALSLFKNDRGLVGVGLSVKGTLDDPQFNWDTSPFRDQFDQLKDKGQQFVEEQKKQGQQLLEEQKQRGLQLADEKKQQGQQLIDEKKQELLKQTPLTTTNVDTLKTQAKSLADTVQSEVKDKAKDAVKGLFKRKKN